MEKIELTCQICGKEFSTEKYIVEKGRFKGCPAVKKMLCSAKCEKQFKERVKKYE
jgi:hypothetical protein